MTDFVALPIRTGDGNVHVNYFRTFLRPFRGATLPSGAQLLANMPNFMEAHTAMVWRDSRTWQAQSVLTFRGVARVRPFILLDAPIAIPMPIPVPDELQRIGVPESIRQLMIPQWHTDSVGLAVAPPPHSFTVQTLKREFETDDDRKIRELVGQRVDNANAGWLEKAANIARDVMKIISPIYGAVDDTKQLVSKLLGNYAVMINQFHFLAGRRSFLIGTVGGLGLNAPGCSPGDWVFETAAVERYSLATYGYATNLGMGGAARVVRPVWIEMGQKLARFFGQPIASIEVRQEEYATLGSASGSALYKDISSRHVALIPGR